MLKGGNLEMSSIFGIRRPSGAAATESELLRLAEATARFAFDGLSVKAVGRVGMGFQPYYTHARSTLETAPACDSYGNLLTFDGRLDNYVDLCAELGLNGLATADSQIVLAAFAKWGENSFSRFIGDWALALWSERGQSLYLARDHAGTRTLYLQDDRGALRWSTHLETFFVDGTSKRLDEGYAACYLASRPIRDLTPYEGVRAVLPAHYVTVQNDKLSQKAHWQWMARNTIWHRSDKEYEEHFLALFRQSVDRRTGPGAPILAQLSGGMDSTSIVCMSDHTRRSQASSAELLDTISFYDDTEPSCNERPYFSLVEAKRGKIGIHIESSFATRTFEPHESSQGIYLLPAADSSAIQRERVLEEALQSKHYRVILSGTGGDEVLGGVPGALPELADSLVSGQIKLFLRRSVDWCLIDRSPFLKSALDTLRYASLLYLNPSAQETVIPPWIAPRLRTICTDRTKKDIAYGHRLGLAPHVIANGMAWWSVLDCLPHLFPRLLSRPEYRYPYLDRDLVEYLFSIPREQVLRPGRRRSLMRRALAQIVPQEILERRRKAFVLRSALATIQQYRGKLEMLVSDSLIASSGFVDPAHLRNALELTTNGATSQWWQMVLRAITFELWLRANTTHIASAQGPLKHGDIILPV
jgi:asparagine synthase (glutamine-hydrolysing)